MTTLGLSYLNYAEQKRSNLAKEAEQHRANIENEERNRSALLEEIRSHQKNEDIKLQELGEKVRSDKATESLRGQELGETKRSHQVSEGQKAAEIGIKSEDLQALIDYRNKSLGLSEETLINNAWNTFAKQVSASGIPFSNVIALGPALSALKTVEDRAVVDKAIGDIVSEVGASISPEGSKERGEMMETLSNIDSQLRSYANKTLGSIFNIADFFTEYEDDFRSATQFSSAIGKLFSAAADGARKISGGVEKLESGVTELYDQWGAEARKWALEKFQDAVKASRKIGIEVSEWFKSRAKELAEDLKNAVLGVRK
jgi:X-X-X-Leu-X-X-Gly heptad repeat protein